MSDEKLNYVLCDTFQEFCDYMATLENVDESKYKHVATLADLVAIHDASKPFNAIRVGLWYKSKLTYKFEQLDMDLNHES